ncbi:MAG: hypothetical protein ACI4AA_10465 [Lachnospiraceae bacterium]
MDFNSTPEQTEPVNQMVQPAEQQIYGQPAEQQIYGQPAGGMPPETGKKKIPPIAIAGIVLAVVLVIAIAISIAVYAGVFGGKAGKVANAFINTFSEQPAIADAFDTEGIVADGQYTVSMEVEAEDISIDLECRVDGLEKQFDGNVGAYNVMSVDFSGALTEEELLLYIPFLSDYVFSYNYREIGTGYLLEDADENEIELINRMFELAYDPQSGEGSEVLSTMEWIESVADNIRETEFESVEKETFEIDGKEVACKGYQTLITQEDMQNALDEIEDQFNAQNGELYELMSEIDETFENPYTEIFDEVRDGIEEISDFDLRFYIYDNQLAAIVAETQKGEKLSILFKGGDRRTQNIVIENIDIDGNEEYIVLEGESDGSSETTRLIVDEEEIFCFIYDSESGKYELNVEEDTNNFSGRISSDKTSVKITVDEFAEFGEDLGYELSMTIRKGAEMKELDGERFDLGNATEDEVYELMDEISNALYGY